MTNNTNYLKLEKIFEEITQLSNLLQLSNWDFSTYLPKGSVNSRSKEISTLSACIHKMKSSEIIRTLIKQALQEPLDEWQRKNLNLIQKQFDETQIIPSSIQKEYSELSLQCEFIWRECRRNNDFKTLIPYLDRLFTVVKKISSIKSQYFGLPQYDVLVDQFDPERKNEELKSIFNETKQKLPELINQIIVKQSTEKVIPLTKPIDKQIQRKIELRLMEIMGFDLERGRLDESVHPFCIGNRDDTRITTKYDEQNLLISSYSVIHELGHGLYTQNLPIDYQNQLVGSFKGYAFHESQSLIMEMQVGASMPFLEFYSKLLRDEFGIIGKEYNAENLFKLKTRVIPSLIRIDADEVTYPMHIIIRSEIEQGIINGEIKAKDLPEIWNNKMREYLGIIPHNNSDGCMQDIHWFIGWLGYFPCYYIGAIIASMLMLKVREQESNLDKHSTFRDFRSINNYLNKNLRQYGSKYSSSDLLYRSTGNAHLSVVNFFDYLKGKYLF